MPAVACEVADGQLAGFQSRERIGFVGHGVCDGIAKPEPISTSHMHCPSSSSTHVSSFHSSVEVLNGEPLSPVIDESNRDSFRHCSHLNNFLLRHIRSNMISPGPTDTPLSMDNLQRPLHGLCPRSRWDGWESPMKSLKPRFFWRPMTPVSSRVSISENGGMRSPSTSRIPSENCQDTCTKPTSGRRNSMCSSVTVGAGFFLEIASKVSDQSFSFSVADCRRNRPKRSTTSTACVSCAVSRFASRFRYASAHSEMRVRIARFSVGPR